jgi:hypothetical protein
MAEQSRNPGAVTNSFTKGMVKDMNETFVGEGLWTHARNLVNNSHDGHTGVVGNEPANLYCVTLPYDLIGAIHLTDDQWVIFTTDDVNSEIGVFDESQCTYEKKVNDPCLGFKRTHLITGASRKRFDCERPVYWSDGINPDRFMDLDNIPWKFTETVTDSCIIRNIIEPRQLDCEKIRMAPLLKAPCLVLTKGKISGTLPNGSYQAVIAYSDNGVRFTNYLGLSEVQSVFTHENVSSSLELVVNEIDTTYDEFELVVLARINGTTVAKKLGNYSTSQGTIFIDRWDQEFETIPVSQIIFRGDASEKSDAIYEVNNYLLKIGDYSKFKFNYQKQANKINTHWAAVEYPADYYHKGGNNTGYLRDEQYAFFIRFIYNTGDRSDSYHIPGRAATASDLTNVIGGDAFETLSSDPVSRERWQVENTGSVESLTSFTLADGGRVVATGDMGYWESTEQYPADSPEIWGDLCGKKIRHHKMPDVTIQGGDIVNHFSNQGQSIVILGVQFSNITVPLDNYGKPISSIVGYEILRGSREGNKTIIANGMFNNMRTYSIPGNPTVEGLFQNYPYNDLRPDSYLTPQVQNGTNGSPDPKSSKLTGYKKNVFSFHSPETTFSNPFLNASEVKIYQTLSGQAVGSFSTPYKHPKFKIATNFTSILTKLVSVIGTVAAVSSVVGGGFDLSMEADEDTPVKLPLLATPFYAGDVATAIGTGVSPITIAQFVATTLANGVILGTLVATGTLSGIYDQQFMRLFMYLAPKVQYAAQYNSHGFYNQGTVTPVGERRREVVDSIYVKNNVQSFNSRYNINNNNRSNFVAVEISSTAPLRDPTVVDDSRFTIGEKSANLNTPITSKIASHYGALKLSMPSQYGQLNGVKQMPISGGCVHALSPGANTSPVLFGGDTYINRFTEKNSMLFFTDWLIGEPDETEYDYTLYAALPYPRFWVHNESKHSEFFKLSDDYRVLDFRRSGTFHVKRGYFYLFNSGVRDYFVESEINLGYRDWETDPARRHYDPYRFVDLQAMFRSDIIKSGNFYKYDYNLSISKLFGSHITWGNILGLDYDPQVAETCYVYRPSRVRYSLPQQEESRKDNWRVYLTNNYKDFQGPVTSIKSVNRTGALFMMARQSPVQFMGVEELKLDGTGAKLTIGDGGLFNQPLQSLVNSEASFEYGSCQNKYSVINTTHGVFWVSQNQGKVFQYAGQINEISRNGMKWWFAQYLPSELLKAYPNYPLYDNPVKGVGVQTMYDNTNEILYITKKDYQPKRTDLLYDANGFYYVSGFSTVVNPPITRTTCAPGYTLINNQCVRVTSTSPIESGTVVNLTRTPFEVYGSLGTKVYNTASTAATFTLLNTNNSFWIRTASPENWNTLTAAEKQAYDLTNGPVNRLAVWGNNNGANLNNYNHDGVDLLPVNQWIGFDVCINIQATKTYYVAIAGDNQYRFSLDGTVILSETGSSTANFNYLHIYPVTITAGSHILRVEGLNTGQKAGFGCEVFDLSDLPGGQTVVDFLNGQTNYDNLNARVIFTTRTATQFSSNLFSCPAGFGLSNPTCNQPVCQRTETVSPIIVTTPGSTIRVPNKVYTPFTDTAVWENASWTISYDCKNQMWLSYHDWKPTFMLPSKTHFMTVNGDSIWKHNLRCDLFCNYYDIEYPFDIEFVSATGQMVNSVRNIEYLLEAYRFYNNCRDKFHILDENFDQAMVYNSEQVSGLLELVIKDKKNPLNLLTYPQVGAQSIKINFSKEEQKSRFNQFWDVTKDRGEFSGVSLPMFLTKPNGYDYAINPSYIDLQKSPLERKKFRHNVNRVWLRKLKSGDVKLLFKISNQKILQSPR